MKTNWLYRDILKGLDSVRMQNHTRAGAETELRRAVSLIEFLIGDRKEPGRKSPEQRPAADSI